MNSTVAIIPARFSSTRFPGKPLALIHGRPMLTWVIEGVQEANKIDEVLVATDDSRIADLAASCGVRCIMTDPTLASGTDRIWAIAKDLKAEFILNVQGDEPLIRGSLIDAALEPLQNDQRYQMSTLANPLSPEDIDNLNSVKVIVNQHMEAIYFSRFPIPYSRQAFSLPTQLAPVYKHIGLYAYKREFLATFCAAPPSYLETHEGLEQLRALELGAKIAVVPVKDQLWGVDTPEDLAKIESFMGANFGKKEGKSRR